MLGRLLPDRLSQWLVAAGGRRILVTQALALSLLSRDACARSSPPNPVRPPNAWKASPRILGPESPDHRA